MALPYLLGHLERVAVQPALALRKGELDAYIFSGNVALFGMSSLVIAWPLLHATGRLARYALIVCAGSLAAAIALVRFGFGQA